uniref:Bm283 n=1 Tax=Brugia malayi TaxID=6279 RepID=A0A0J9XNK8_BRUMA|nr:Bm283 [Brugia malayi]
MVNCPICLEADNGLIAFAALKCGHVFHRQCISSWLAIDKNTKICPVCRKSANSFLTLYFFSTVSHFMLILLRKLSFMNVT